MRFLILLALAAVVSTGCSSDPETASASSGVGGSAIQCKSAAAPSRAACTECQVTQCRDLAVTMMGTDPKAFGGVCAAFFSCQCECPSGSDSCTAGCSAKIDSACSKAFSDFQSCVMSKCSSACG